MAKSEHREGWAKWPRSVPVGTVQSGSLEDYSCKQAYWHTEANENITYIQLNWWMVKYLLKI